MQFQSYYWDVLKSMLQDKKGWTFSDNCRNEGYFLVAKRPSPDGRLCCCVEWKDAETYCVNIFGTMDRKSSPPRLHINGNSAYLLGLANDFKALYNYHNEPKETDYLNILDSVFSCFTTTKQGVQTNGNCHLF